MDGSNVGGTSAVLGVQQEASICQGPARVSGEGKDPLPCGWYLALPWILQEVLSDMGQAGAFRQLLQRSSPRCQARPAPLSPVGWLMCPPHTTGWWAPGGPP